RLLMGAGGHPKFDRNVFALDIAGLAQTLAERAHTICIRNWCPAAEEPDHRHPRLLRARRDRPRRRAAEQRYERAALHSITSSARPSSGSGTVSQALWRS